MSPAPSPGSSTTLDPASLAQLRELEAVRPGMLAKTAELFLGQAELRLATMDRKLAVGDAEAVADAAHALKGSSHTIGARELGALAAKIELEARAGGDTRELIVALHDALAAIRPAIQALGAEPPE
ncbi:Hpt domain protein [Enhygromyxa salina]|uniref:Hpt domain protein n=1 Tax=Enhygromyxa salina TaxID=215803 RepID=A0A2S9YB80_9BACT|nr:Hpt domain-containing protein [Enhygromyxa salina]PRQ02312.1 Hpt domain protein [Enhygromyxa salina]